MNDTEKIATKTQEINQLQIKYAPLLNKIENGKIKIKLLHLKGEYGGSMFVFEPDQGNSLLVGDFENLIEDALFLDSIKNLPDNSDVSDKVLEWIKNKLSQNRSVPVNPELYDNFVGA